MYTFLVISFAQICYLPLLVQVILCNYNLWSICVGLNILIFEWSENLATRDTRAKSEGLPLLFVVFIGNIPFLKALRIDYPPSERALTLSIVFVFSLLVESKETPFHWFTSNFPNRNSFGEKLHVDTNLQKMSDYKDGAAQNMLLWRHKGRSVKTLYIENYLPYRVCG